MIQKRKAPLQTRMVAGNIKSAVLKCAVGFDKMKIKPNTGIKRRNEVMSMDQNHLLVMSRDTVVAQFINGRFEILNQKLLPLYLKRTNNLSQWLTERAIDSHRPNSRLLKRMLRLAQKDDISTVLEANGATITDTYWVKAPDSNLCYDDVRFRENYFDTVALFGDSSGFDLPYQRTPELTNIGSYEKCWKRRDDGWYLLKRGNLPSLFSEIFVSKMGAALGMDVVPYHRHDQDVVCCKDFTNGAAVNFEDALGLMSENFDTDFSYNYRVFSDLMPSMGTAYADMLFLDAICFNPDRHIHNYGILRDVETGDVLKFAPNFDNNMALMATSPCEKPSVGFLQDYRDFFAENDLFLPTIQKEMIEQVYDETGKQFTSEELEHLPPKERVISFVMESAGYIAPDYTQKQVIDICGEKPSKAITRNDRGFDR